MNSRTRIRSPIGYAILLRNSGIAFSQAVILIANNLSKPFLNTTASTG